MNIIIKNSNKKKSKNEIYFNILFIVYGISIVLFDNINFLFIIHIINSLIGVSFILLIYEEKLFLNIFLKIYLIFTLLGFVSSIWSLDSLYAAKKSLTLVLILINIVIIFNINKKYNNYSYLVYGLFIAIFINFLWLIGLIDLGLTYEGWRFQGSVLQSNNFSFILMFVMMMIVYYLNVNSKNLFYSFLLSLLFLISFYMIFMTASKAGLFSSLLLIGLFLYDKIKIKKITFILLFFFLGYIIVSFTPIVEYISKTSPLDFENTFINLTERIEIFLFEIKRFNTISSPESSTGERIYMIKNGLEMFTNSPILGNGIAAFEIKYGFYAHNNIIELLVSFGIVGLLIYYSLYVNLFFIITKINNFKMKVFFFIIIVIFIVFDQSIVSFSGKFRVLALLIVYMVIEENIKKFNIKKINHLENKLHG